MGHLVTTIRDTSLEDAVFALEGAHRFIVERAHAAVSQVPTADSSWGVHMKRLEVDLERAGRPVLVGKDREKLAEVVNMLATLERLLAALRWFAGHPEFGGLQVAVCHPSTSSGDNDIVLVDTDGAVRVRCEVCDVASSSAGQNGKERKDVASLGCTSGVPLDSVRRFVCTSPEFAAALESRKRAWAGVAYRYTRHQTVDGT